MSETVPLFVALTVYINVSPGIPVCESGITSTITSFRGAGGGADTTDTAISIAAIPVHTNKFLPLLFLFIFIVYYEYPIVCS